MSTESIDPQFANYQRPEKLQQRLNAMHCVAGRCDGFSAASAPARVAIIVGRWHNYIVDRLLQGALDTAHECGISDAPIVIVQAPGAF